MIGRKDLRREAQDGGKKITIRALKGSRQSVKVGSTNGKRCSSVQKKDKSAGSSEPPVLPKPILK